MGRTTEEDFRKLSDAIAHEVVLANVDYRMYEDLKQACDKHGLVVDYSGPFWPMTVDAHLNSVILRLCRVYDTERNSLNLSAWLRTIQQNLHWFTPAAFETRKTNPDSEYPGDLDVAQLKCDLQHARPKSNSVVRSLIQFRGNMFVHLGESWVLRPSWRSTRIPIDSYGPARSSIACVGDRQSVFASVQFGGAFC
jgi:hypothetical protein